MDNDHIHNIWQLDQQGQQTMTASDFAALLEPQAKRGINRLYFYVWFQVAALVATVGLGVANIVGYQDNPTMLAVQISVTLLAGAFLGVSLSMLRKLAQIDRNEGDLRSLVRSRLDFYINRYELWLWTAAAGWLLLAFGINTLVDNQDAIYRINKPLVWVGTNVAMFLIIYGSAKLSLHSFVAESRAILADLETQILDQTASLGDTQVQTRKFRLAYAVVLTTLFIAGIVAFLMAG